MFLLQGGGQRHSQSPFTPYHTDCGVLGSAALRPHWLSILMCTVAHRRWEAQEEGLSGRHQGRQEQLQGRAQLRGQALPSGRCSAQQHGRRGATTTQGQGHPPVVSVKPGVWRARRDSNPRPSAPEADALSTELRAHKTTAVYADAVRACVVAVVSCLLETAPLAASPLRRLLGRRWPRATASRRRDRPGHGPGLCSPRANSTDATACSSQGSGATSCQARNRAVLS